MTERSLDIDYLVVGAGAMGMAFTDALIDHADVHVTLVDRRHAAGGHWLDAYPFVQLHQASVFYGVASTLLGGGAIQERGPEAGLQERARQSQIRAYYDDVLSRRFLGSGRVSFLGGCEYRAEGSSHVVTSRVSGKTVELGVRRRVVDATYLSPTIPATTPPPFGVADGVRVVAVNELASLAAPPERYVIVGSGKTATDGIVWLLANGVKPERIVWVRPREPWMLNRAVVQPDPEVALGFASGTMAAAADAASLEEFFLRLESAGIMLRVDRAVTPTMAKAPTLAAWELDRLRTIENVVRLGHITHVTRREIVLDNGSVPLAPGSLVVHCAAAGLQYPPMVPIFGSDKIRLQTIRAGAPCFGAALAGYVEATLEDDRVRNWLCPPNTLPDRPLDWARMQVRGAIAAARFGTEPDVADWVDRCFLNPGRVDPRRRGDPAVRAATSRLADDVARGLPRMADLAHEPLTSTGEASRPSGARSAL
ncbi:MAG TPA: NAD(P)-binding protein [Acidimicrobiales bacterium]|nr:NAD(P)-binding protein [Acidimicrobiales bacterium]